MELKRFYAIAEVGVDFLLVSSLAKSRTDFIKCLLFDAYNRGLKNRIYLKVNGKKITKVDVDYALIELFEMPGFKYMHEVDKMDIEVFACKLFDY